MTQNYLKIVKEKQHLEAFTGQGISVTRLGNLLDFGQLFKAFGNN